MYIYILICIYIYVCVCGWLIERFPVGGVDHNPIQPLQDTNQPATNHQKKTSHHFASQISISLLLPP